ncbi:MAG: hypothetical protein AAFX94_04070 [Myxococcota bacterium]
MTLEIALICALTAAAPEEKEPPLEVFRVPFRELVGRTLGSTSRPVSYDWRRSTVGFGVVGSQLTELNNFRSGRFGGTVRTPIGGMIGELSLSRVWTRSTDSSRSLAQTPFRQAGRPNRLELDVGLSLPLAEGIVTWWPSFVPAMEMVFSATASVRYLYYFEAQDGFGLRDRLSALFRPTLTDAELDNLEDARNAGMEVDRARVNALIGFTTDFYFSNGAFLTPRVMAGLPTGNGLGLWWELSFGLGWMF